MWLIIVMIPKQVEVSSADGWKLVCRKQGDGRGESSYQIEARNFHGISYFGGKQVSPGKIWKPVRRMFICT